MTAIAEAPPPAAPPFSYRWARTGDINAFFGLMLDNVVNLAVLAGILVAGFGFPAALVYTRMFPGTALGADVRRHRVHRDGHHVSRVALVATTITIMLLGLDAPSTIGMGLTVLGPAFLAAKAKMPVGDAAIVALAGGHGGHAGLDGRVQGHHVVLRRRRAPSNP